METDTLSAEVIKKGLQTSCFGQEVLYCPSTTSTNRVAKKLAQKGIEDLIEIQKQYLKGLEI